MSQIDSCQSAPYARCKTSIVQRIIGFMRCGMRRVWAMTLGLGILVGTASTGVAQTAGDPLAPLVSSRAIPADTSAVSAAPDLLTSGAEREAELQRWIEEF